MCGEKEHSLSLIMFIANVINTSQGTLSALSITPPLKKNDVQILVHSTDCHKK